jgi:RND family efflux transporter MFP subunit
MNSNPSSSAPTPIRLTRLLQIVVVLVIIGLVVGFVPRWIHRHNLAKEETADSVLTVNVISPVASKPDFGTPLPAEVQAFTQASIHARASGYLKNWFVDIGQNVTNGQLLAEIETPEVDSQLAQAKAELDQANANLALAKTTADRWTELLKTASVSEQETVEKTADLTLKQADVEAARANVQRLEDLKNFDHVTAPFDGTVTLRNTDIGALISADSGPELFRVAQTDPLRVYVRVPQQFIHAIVPGQKAELTFQELQGRVFPATVTRTAGAVDTSSRTLQVELQVANPHNDEIPTAANVLVLSDNALIFRAQGMQVAVLDKDNKVQLRSVKLGRDFGDTVEVLAGLNADDRVIVNPPDSIADGVEVQVEQPAETNSAAK